MNLFRQVCSCLYSQLSSEYHLVGGKVKIITTYNNIDLLHISLDNEDLPKNDNLKELQLLFSYAVYVLCSLLIFEDERYLI